MVKKFTEKIYWNYVLIIMSRFLLHIRKSFRSLMLQTLYVVNGMIQNVSTLYLRNADTESVLLVENLTESVLYKFLFVY